MESMCGAKISHLIEWSMVIAKMGVLTLYWNLLGKNLRQQELTWYLTILRIIMVNLKSRIKIFYSRLWGINFNDLKEVSGKRQLRGYTAQKSEVYH